MHRAVSARHRAPAICSRSAFRPATLPPARTPDRQSPRRRPASQAAAQRRPSGPAIRVAGEREHRGRPAARPSTRAVRSIPPRPASASTRAFCRWWSSVAVGSGTRIAGFPAAVTSASVLAPARQTTRIGGAHLPVHLEQERLDPSRESGTLVTLANQGHVGFAGLVSDSEWPGRGRQLRRCLHTGHVDRVRALRAAKDQDSERRARRRRG